MPSKPLCRPRVFTRSNQRATRHLAPLLCSAFPARAVPSIAPGKKHRWFMTCNIPVERVVPWLDFSFRRFRGFSIVVYTRGLWLCLIAVIFPPVRSTRAVRHISNSISSDLPAKQTAKHPFRSNFSTQFIHQPRICHDDIPAICASPGTATPDLSFRLFSLGLSLPCVVFLFLLHADLLPLVLLSWGRILQRPPGRCLLIAIPWSFPVWYAETLRCLSYGVEVSSRGIRCFVGWGGRMNGESPGGLIFLVMRF
jgi:hypothetical protein